MEAARLKKDARRRGKELEHAEREERAAEYGLGGASARAKVRSAGRQQQSQLSHAEDASTAAGPSGAAERQSPEDRETLPPSGESGGATSTPFLFYTQLLIPAREEVLALDDRWSEVLEPLGGGTPSSGDVLLLCEECCAQLHRAYAGGLEYLYVKHRGGYRTAYTRTTSQGTAEGAKSPIPYTTFIKRCVSPHNGKAAAHQPSSLRHVGRTALR